MAMAIAHGFQMGFTAPNLLESAWMNAKQMWKRNQIDW